MAKAPAPPSPEVQQLLGQDDLPTTQVYLKVAGRGLE
jgi:site-specific recombinase XerD